MKIFKGILKVLEKVTIIHLIVKVVRLEKTQNRLVQLGKDDYEQLCAVERDVEKLDFKLFNLKDDLRRLKERIEA